MGLKLYEYQGKIYKASSKEVLVRRLFPPYRNQNGNIGIKCISEKLAMIKKVKR